MVKKKEGKPIAKGGKDSKTPAKPKIDGRKRNGSKPGEHRGGRGPGVPNKKTVELNEALAAAGYDPERDNPVTWMVRVYKGEVTMPVVVKTEAGNIVRDVALEPSLRVKCMGEVAQYLFPKRKAVELSGPDGEAVAVTMIDAATMPGWLSDPQNPKNKEKGD